ASTSSPGEYTHYALILIRHETIDCHHRRGGRFVSLRFGSERPGELYASRRSSPRRGIAGPGDLGESEASRKPRELGQADYHAHTLVSLHVPRTSPIDSSCHAVRVGVAGIVFDPAPLGQHIWS